MIKLIQRACYLYKTFLLSNGTKKHFCLLLSFLKPTNKKNVCLHYNNKHINNRKKPKKKTHKVTSDNNVYEIKI